MLLKNMRHGGICVIKEYVLWRNVSRRYEIWINMCHEGIFAKEEYFPKRNICHGGICTMGECVSWRNINIIDPEHQEPVACRRRHSIKKYAL